MHLHHDKHHQAYVDNANKALAGTEWEKRPVEQVLLEIDLMPEEIRATVRNNAGGHANHTLFWEIMSPDGGGAPSGSLAHALDHTLGDGLHGMKKAGKHPGGAQFRSRSSWVHLAGATPSPH